MIYSAKLSVFFIDEAQRVTFQDIGSVSAIEEWALQLGSDVTVLDLTSQFRCNGSDGHLAWVDNALQMRETANPTLDDIDYEVKVFDDPKDLMKAIIEKNRATNKARVVAGYCWDWKSKKDAKAQDIEIPKFSFKAQWNLTTDGNLWLIAEDSVNQVGCIHTCQGLEVDYVGVIIGDDFVIRDGEAVTDAAKRSTQDRSIKGYKTMLKQRPAEAQILADEIIKNTYRTLMTRGQKGCYIFCLDEETNEYFKQAALRTEPGTGGETLSPFHGLQLPVVSSDEATPYHGYVPLFDIAAAAGEFSSQQFSDDCLWVQLPEDFVTREGMFVAQVVGESMNKRIPNGVWCLFKANPGGTRNNKIVIVQHRDIDDPDHGGSFTVKVYQSEKTVEDGIAVNQRIILKPETTAFGYAPIVLEDVLEDLRVVGEFVAVL